jgi:mannose-1-phosphate guanylyltransferase
MSKANYYGMIMAGGRGTRFWPRSRRRHAKQVLEIAGGRTLIQGTVDRLKPVIPPERLWVITNEYLRDEIVRQLPEIPKRQIIAEPAQRNTAPCNGLAAHILHSIDPDAVIGVFPADHVISKPAPYRKLLRPAFRAAEKGQIVVLGVQPRWAETGYGYIEFPKGAQPGAADAVPVVSFREKPDPKTALEFVEAGNFYWNAGMFFWRADVFLEALRRHLPKAATLLSALPAFGSRAFVRKMREVYPRCQDISVDYAILEKADNVAGIPLPDIGWNDVGSWRAVWELLPRDADRNAARSELLALASAGNYVDAKGKLVALVGVNDLVVVDTPDALLVASREQAHRAGEIVKLLEKMKREDLL